MVGWLGAWRAEDEAEVLDVLELGLWQLELLLSGSGPFGLDSAGCLVSGGGLLVTVGCLNWFMGCWLVGCWWLSWGDQVWPLLS